MSESEKKIKKLQAAQRSLVLALEELIYRFEQVAPGDDGLDPSDAMRLKNARAAIARATKK